MSQDYMVYMVYVCMLAQGEYECIGMLALNSKELSCFGCHPSYLTTGR